MPFSDSRYANGRYDKAAQPLSGVVQTAVDRVFPTLMTRFSTYTWVEGDRIDIVSRKLHGSEDSWWQIMDLNPEITDPFNIAPGTLLRVLANAQ